MMKLTIWCLGWARRIEAIILKLLFYVTTKNVSHQQLYSLILKEDSIVLEEELSTC